MMCLLTEWNEEKKKRFLVNDTQSTVESQNNSVVFGLLKCYTYMIVGLAPKTSDISYKMNNLNTSLIKHLWFICVCVCVFVYVCVF